VTSQAQYALELPGSSVDLLADTDEQAVVKAKAYLAERRIHSPGLKLFRYPVAWLDYYFTKGMIEVPLYQLTPY
jgi:hypothetical protein